MAGDLPQAFEGLEQHLAEVTARSVAEFAEEHELEPTSELRVWCLAGVHVREVFTDRWGQPCVDGALALESLALPMEDHLWVFDGIDLEALGTLHVVALNRGLHRALILPVRRLAKVLGDVMDEPVPYPVSTSWARSWTSDPCATDLEAVAEETVRRSLDSSRGGPPCP